MLHFMRSILPDGNPFTKMSEDNDDFSEHAIEMRFTTFFSVEGIFDWPVEGY